jgi:hypothetical protein
MDRVKANPKHQTRCASCGRMTPNYDSVHYGSAGNGFRELCNQCLNAEIAEADGLKFEHIQFAPVELTDCTGARHIFHFRTRLFGPGVALDAFEVRGGVPAGYQFQVIGAPDSDLLALLARLIAKIRRALSVTHIRQGELGPQIDDKLVRGTIEWDSDEDGPVPLLVVDGREIAWEQFGRMLMTFEGWQFKLEIRDKSEEF